MLHFCENPGKIQSRAELLKKMTGRELKPHDRTVDVTIRRIRKHFESTPDTPEIIATIHGEGYRFCGDRKINRLYHRQKKRRFLAPFLFFNLISRYVIDRPL